MLELDVGAVDGTMGVVERGIKQLIGSEWTVLKVPRVASKKFDVMVPELPFSSLRRTLISGHTRRVN